jgi:hypothetical protein
MTIYLIVVIVVQGADELVLSRKDASLSLCFHHLQLFSLLRPFREFLHLALLLFLLSSLLLFRCYPQPPPVGLAADRRGAPA